MISLSDTYCLSGTRWPGFDQDKMDCLEDGDLKLGLKYFLIACGNSPFKISCMMMFIHTNIGTYNLFIVDRKNMEKYQLVQ